MSDTPRLPGACDCHVHIYEPVRFPLKQVIGAFTWCDYLAMQNALGLDRVVLVQANGYGFDNSCLLDALAQAGDRARAIAVVPADVEDAQLQVLHAAGVRGVRFMLIPGGGGALGWDALETIAARIAPLGWVINLQLDSRGLAEHESRLRALPCRLSIDHTGKFLEPVTPGHEGFLALMRLLDGGNTWVKVSAPYETSKTGAPAYEDVSRLARTLVSAFPDRCLWASNWPHPGRNPLPEDAPLLALLNDWAPRAADRVKILVDNPAALYGW